MKRILIFAALALVCAGIGRAAYEAAQPLQPPLSKYVPAGALLYLEAQDFSYCWRTGIPPPRKSNGSRPAIMRSSPARACSCASRGRAINSPLRPDFHPT